jgi:hypothetical protein
MTSFETAYNSNFLSTPQPNFLFSPNMFQVAQNGGRKKTRKHKQTKQNKTKKNKQKNKKGKKTHFKIDDNKSKKNEKMRFRKTPYNIKNKQ